MGREEGPVNPLTLIGTGSLISETLPGALWLRLPLQGAGVHSWSGN